MIKVEFTEQEIQALVKYMDVAVKQLGINAVKDVFILISKLESGVQAESEESAPDVKPAVKKPSKT